MKLLLWLLIASFYVFVVVDFSVSLILWIMRIIRIFQIIRITWRIIILLYFMLYIDLFFYCLNIWLLIILFTINSDLTSCFISSPVPLYCRSNTMQQLFLFRWKMTFKKMFHYSFLLFFRWRNCFASTFRSFSFCFCKWRWFLIN